MSKKVVIVILAVVLSVSYIVKSKHDTKSVPGFNVQHTTVRM